MNYLISKTVALRIDGFLSKITIQHVADTDSFLK